MLLPVLAALLLLAPATSADVPPPPPDDPKSSPWAFFDDDVRFSLGFTSLVGLQQAGPVTQAAFTLAGIQSEKLWYLLRPATLSRRRTEALLLGTATAVGSSIDNPLTTWGTMLAGSQWGLWKLDPDRFEKLDTDYLRGVRDERPLPENLLNKESEELEAMAYYDAVMKAHRTSLAGFESVVDPDVTFGHIFREPGKQRGKVVRIDGRIRRIRKYDAPEMLALAGIPTIYEAWLFNERYGFNPVCLITTELPPGVKVGEVLDGPAAEFVGYFFKKYRYKSPDSPGKNQFRDAPLVIGRIKTATSLIQESDSSWTRGLLPLFVTVVGCTGLFVLVLTWWFRRNDARVRSRVKTASATFVPPPVFEAPEQPPAEDWLRNEREEPFPGGRAEDR
jgi:hypothetical protein